MNNKNTTPLYPVIYNREGFAGIKKFDCITIDLIGGEGCDMFTHLCVSWEWIKENPTSKLSKARVVITEQDDWTVFECYDDVGGWHRLDIHNSLSSDIAFARGKVEEYGLLR